MSSTPRKGLPWARCVVSRAALAASSAALLVALTPGPANAGGRVAVAGTLPPSLAMFAHCPVANKAVTVCLYSSTSSTTFKIGSTTVNSTVPATISLGVISKPSGQFVVVLPDDGTAPLTSPAIPLPGGLTGVPGIDGGVLQVTVTPQLVGVPKLSLGNLLAASGAGLTLPIDVRVSTPTGLLGSSCTIGSAATPIVLRLTTGKTSPPPPNTSITGATGTLSAKSNGLISITGLRLVDNAFAVPGANGCGPLGSLDPILDADKGLPSAAGSNAATLSGSAYTVPASLVRRYLG